MPLTQPGKKRKKNPPALRQRAKAEAKSPKGGEQGTSTMYLPQPAPALRVTTSSHQHQPYAPHNGEPLVRRKGLQLGQSHAETMRARQGICLACYVVPWIPYHRLAQAMHARHAQGCWDLGLLRNSGHFHNKSAWGLLTGTSYHNVPRRPPCKPGFLGEFNYSSLGSCGVRTRW